MHRLFSSDVIISWWKKDKPDEYRINNTCTLFLNVIQSISLKNEFLSDLDHVDQL